MPYEKEIEQLREQLVRNYVEALNTLSIDPIIDSVHPDFKYMLHGSFGIGTELRYLGFLYKCFHQMKKEGKTIKAELVWVEDGTYTFPAVKLHSPTDIRFIYQESWYNFYDWKFKNIEDEMILYVRMKENKIFRIICDTKDSWEKQRWLIELRKPTRTIIYTDTEHNVKKITPPTQSDFVYPQMEHLPTVNRVEVIDHSGKMGDKEYGRVYTKWNAKFVEISFQDDKRTLKIFIK